MNDQRKHHNSANSNDDLLRRVVSSLDAANRHMEHDLVQRLTRARNHALHSKPEPRHSRLRPVWFSAAAAGLLFVITVTLQNRTNVSGNPPLDNDGLTQSVTQSGVDETDYDLSFSNQDLELLSQDDFAWFEEELEFYAWVEEEMETLDNSSQSPDNERHG